LYEHTLNAEENYLLKTDPMRIMVRRWDKIWTYYETLVDERRVCEVMYVRSFDYRPEGRRNTECLQKTMGARVMSQNET